MVNIKEDIEESAVLCTILTKMAETSCHISRSGGQVDRDSKRLLLSTHHRIQFRMHRVQLQAPLAEAKAQRIEATNATGYASPHSFIM
jgi:hypothetical protein